MEPIPVWVFLMVEVSTDGGLVGHYWLMKRHTFPTLPPIGYELDYRAQTRETVVLDRVLVDPAAEGELRGFQDSWLSIGVGDLAMWEHAGWQKRQMTDADVEANRNNTLPRRDN